GSFRLRNNSDEGYKPPSQSSSETLRDEDYKPSSQSSSETRQEIIRPPLRPNYNELILKPQEIVRPPFQAEIDNIEVEVVMPALKLSTTTADTPNLDDRNIVTECEFNNIKVEVFIPALKPSTKTRYAPNLDDRKRTTYAPNLDDRKRTTYAPNLDDRKRTTSTSGIGGQKRNRWTDPELRCLKRGMKEYGTKWEEILKHYGKPDGPLKMRTAVNLKDKARNEKIRRIREDIELDIFELATI
ncbi:25889_t:CDS:1, partial [Dentiscutata erythropus]